MEIAVENVKGGVRVVKIAGDLDASSYLELVNATQKLYDGGAKKLLLDLTDLAFISSAGLASLHIITRIFKEEKSGPETGWGAYKSADQEKEKAMQGHVKLYNPSPDVDTVLDTVGFKQFFEVFSNYEEAVNSFS